MGTKEIIEKILNTPSILHFLDGDGKSDVISKITVGDIIEPDDLEIRVGDKGLIRLNMFINADADEIHHNVVNMENGNTHTHNMIDYLFYNYNLDADYLQDVVFPKKILKLLGIENKFYIDLIVWDKDGNFIYEPNLYT
jgi:hypothetical protein